MSASTFEQGLADALEAFQAPPKPRKPQAPPVSIGGSMIVVYCARRHRLAPDERYSVKADSVSRFQARLAAERDARERQLQFAHVVEYRMEAAQ